MDDCELPLYKWVIGNRNKPIVFKFKTQLIMPVHDVYATLPNALLGKMDAFFDIYRDKKKLGTITISKGAIEWYPANAKLPRTLSWTKFDELMQLNGKIKTIK